MLTGRAVESNRRHQDLLSNWVRWFPFYKACLPFHHLSDSYEFSDGNLASLVLTEIALPTHLDSKKCTVWGVDRAHDCVCRWITNIVLLFVSCFVKIHCENKQPQPSQFVTCDWCPFCNISMASEQSCIEWWRHVEYLHLKHHWGIKSCRNLTDISNPNYIRGHFTIT